jgi:hypothetical protein
MITALEGKENLFSANESPEGVSINEKYLNLAHAIAGKGASSSNDGRFSSAIAAASKVLASNKVSAMQPDLPDFGDWPDSECFYSTSKSGKVGVGTKSNKIERFSTESGLYFGILSPATIYNGVVSLPGIRNPVVEIDEPDIEDVIATQTLINLLILGDYLKCAGTKVENLLTVKLHVNALFATGPDFQLLPISVFLLWWFTVTGIAPPTGEGGSGIPGVTWNFPTFSIESAFGIVPPVGGSIGDDRGDPYFVMFEATAFLFVRLFVFT